MKNPSTPPITAEQSRSARRHLGLTQANVIEQGELAAHKLKNFETGRFIPDAEFLNKLRAFYEETGYEFNDNELAKTENQSHGIGIVVPAQNGRFLVDPNLTLEEVDSILERMDKNDAQLAHLMQRKLESGFISSYSEQTDADTKEIYGLMAENYIHFRTLQGRNFLTPPPEKTKPKTQGELLSSLYATVLLGNQQQPEEAEEA